MPDPPRYLGLDIGSKRIGVAVSGPLSLPVRALLTIYRKSPREDLRSAARLARKHGCAAVVVGNPLHMSGEVSPQALKAQKFARELGEVSGLPIHLWDERLTTREAHGLLYAEGRPRSEHGMVVDQVAAALILQGFLDAQSVPPLPQGV